MKKKLRKTFYLFMVVGMLFQIFAPTMVFAVTYQDGNNVTIGGNPVINGNTFEYTNGNVTITKNGNPVNVTSFDVEVGDEIVITLNPDTNYFAQLYDNGGDYNVFLDNNSYSFTIGHADSKSLSFTPSFSSQSGQEDPGIEAMKFDFKINGKSFYNVAIGDTLTVSNDFNMNSLDEFYVTKIVIEHDDPVDNEVYEYDDGEYSLDLKDRIGRQILESHLTKSSDNYALLRVESHAYIDPNDENSGMLQADLDKYGKTIDDYFAFYITNINFIKEAFKGVEVSTGDMPDNYDFTSWNGADLNGTTKSNPGKVTAYYGENTISFSSIVSSGISEISLVGDSGIPSSAVSINNVTGEVTILSNYYNEIPLQIKLEDGTIGYITVNRIGIFISDLNVGADTLYHGAATMISGNLNVDKDKKRVAATFYHEDTTTYEDYDLIVNITYADGSTETTSAQGVGDVHNSSGEITGSDYILWKGNSNVPKKISVIAVKKNALSNSETFGGATFGSGSGVEWECRKEGEE